jgi:cysteine desulfurase
MDIQRATIYGLVCLLAVITVVHIAKSVAAAVVYLDNNGTTQIFPESLDVMNYVYRNYYGNASALYSLGSQSKQLLEKCREKMASMLNCKASEIFFTSGATESNNIAIRGVFSKHKDKGKHVIMTSIEHPSVDETVKTLDGADVTVLEVDKYGVLNLDHLRNAIRKDTVLVTVIMGNNEIGTLQDIKAMAALCRAQGVHFHCDMTQVIGKYIVNFTELDVDSATGSGHKFHGPKASGFMYLRKGLDKFDSCMSGGHQEKNVRSGTENIPGIVSMCYSLALCHRYIQSGKAQKIKEMRDWMKNELIRRIPGTIVNGHPTYTLYNTLSLCVPVNSRKLLMALDKRRIYVNTGSACSQGASSRVLDAIGVPIETQDGSIRISLGFMTTWSESVKAVNNIVDLCRNK